MGRGENTGTGTLKDHTSCYAFGGKNIILTMKTKKYQIDIFTTVNITILIKKFSKKTQQQTNKKNKSIKETD